MKPLTLKINAGTGEDVGVVGDYVRVQSASVPVRIETEDGQTDATIEQGDALNLKPFKRLRVSHSDAAEQTIKLLIGDGTSADSAKVGGQVSIASMPDVSIRAGAFFGKSVATVGTVPASFRAAELRRFLFLQNIGDAGDIYFGLGSAAIGQGIKLGPGDSYTFDVWVPQETLYAVASVAGCQLSFMVGQ